jgi:DNA-directed RNA polymerase subunit beta
LELIKDKLSDKIGKRHGNKGVVKILPHKLMPRLPDGDHADICVNPLSVISRMNIGQIFEMHLAASLMDLKKNMLEMIRTKKSQRIIKKYLLDYMKIVDNSENNWYCKQFERGLPKVIDEKFVTDLSLIQPPFESAKVDMIIKALEYTNTPMRIKVFDPIYNQEILNPVSWGYLYFFRMVHIAETRLAARGIAAYNRRTLQPPGGRKNKGGQRIGEMETCCFIAHGSSANLHECMTTKSDCTDLKNDYIRSAIESDFVRKPEKLDSVPESVKLLNAYLLVAGVKKD